MRSIAAHDITGERSSKRLSAARVRRTIARILKKNILCAIATVGPDGRVHVNTAYFACSTGLELYLPVTSRIAALLQSRRAPTRCDCGVRFDADMGWARSRIAAVRNLSRGTRTRRPQGGEDVCRPVQTVHEMAGGARYGRYGPRVPFLPIRHAAREGLGRTGVWRRRVGDGNHLTLSFITASARMRASQTSQDGAGVETYVEVEIILFARRSRYARTRH